jgi:hypothetical protein
LLLLSACQAFVATKGELSAGGATSKRKLLDLPASLSADGADNQRCFGMHQPLNLAIMFANRPLSVGGLAIQKALVFDVRHERGHALPIGGLAMCPTEGKLIRVFGQVLMRNVMP